MFASLGRALAFVLRSRPVRAWSLKALLLTIVLFVVLLVGIEYLLALPAHARLALGQPRARTAWRRSSLLIGLFAVGGPVAAMFASLYLDRVADAIEARSYPGDAQAPGMSLSHQPGRGCAARGRGASSSTFCCCRPRRWLPGAGEIVTIIANGFLAGPGIFRARGASPSVARSRRCAAQAQRRTHLSRSG